MPFDQAAALGLTVRAGDCADGDIEDVGELTLWWKTRAGGQPPFPYVQLEGIGDGDVDRTVPVTNVRMPL